MNALKLESLPIETNQANEIVESIRDFLIDLGFSKDRISELECRRRDGFIPDSHNYGGLEAVAFSDQSIVRGMGGTGFTNADATLEKYNDYDIERFEESFGVKYDSWTEAQREEFYESQANDSESTVLYSLDAMHTGIERGIHSLNLRICVCVKDAPYHRQYDDLIEIDLTFRTVKSLQRQLKQVARRADVKKFSGCLTEAF